MEDLVGIRTEIRQDRRSQPVAPGDEDDSRNLKVFKVFCHVKCQVGLKGHYL